MAARRRLLALQATQPQRNTEPLLDFIPRLTPGFERPEHLAPIAEAIEQAVRGPIRLLFGVPPQHGKTELIKHGLVWWMVRRPGSRNAYISFETTRAEQISREIIELAKLAGLDPQGTRALWKAGNGASLLARGADGSITGQGIDGLFVVDDPHKNRKAAESRVQRQDVMNLVRSTAEGRMHPSASFIGVHTRWHPDDMIGQLVREQGWTYINLPAVNDGSDARRPVGAALWEAQRPLAWLEDKRARVHEYEWASQWQGNPRPRGDALFGEPHYYERLPEGCAVGYGVDLAYTAKTSGCHSVALRLCRSGDTFFVHDVQRKQVDATSFALTLKALQAAWPGVMLWHCATSELGAGQFLQQLLGARWFRTELASAIGDKFLRAQPVAAGWRRGKVLLPAKAPWLDAFLSEVMAFTGINDASDDQVDALASAFSLLTRQAPRRDLTHLPPR